LLISIAISGADIRYHPGAFNVIVTKSSTTTVSSNPQRTFTNYERVLDKAEKRLAAMGRLSMKYQHALANSFFGMARAHYYYYDDRTEYNRLLQKALALNPTLHPGRTWPAQKRSYVILYSLFGFWGADYIAGVRRRLRSQIHNLFKTKVIVKSVSWRKA
jgi:hypothetical protein